MFAERRVAICHRRHRRMEHSGGRSVAGDDHRAVRTRNDGQRHRPHGVPSACWYRRTVTLPAIDDGEHMVLHFGAVDYEATVWVDGQRLCCHEGGYTPFSTDVTPWCRAHAWTSSCVPSTIRRISRSRAASRTGSSSRTRSGIRARAASGRRSGSRWCRRCGSTASGGGRISSAGRSACESWLGGARARWPAAARAARRVGDQLIADDTYSVISRRSPSADRAVGSGHRRLPQRAVVVPESPTLISASLELWGDRGQCSTRSQLHGAAVDRDAARTHRPQQPAVSAAAGARPGLLAGSGMTAPDDARAQAGCRAGQGDGLQRRAQAPEARGPALPVLGRRLGLLVWAEMPSAYRFTQALGRAR